MRNVNITWKTLPVVVLVLAGIGYRAYSRMPGYRTFMDGTETLSSEESWIVSFEMLKAGKVRLTATMENGKMDVFMVDAATDAAIQAGKYDESQNNINNIASNISSISMRELKLAKGEYAIYFQPVDDSRQHKLSYDLEIYNDG